MIALPIALFAAALPPDSGPAPQAPNARIARKLEWFQDLKFGFMAHWGAYSQWGCIESWPLIEEDKWARPDDLPAWSERGKDMARFMADYWQLPRTFNPTKFDPAKWAEAAQAAGMKYLVFTTKHHDGFSMYDTQLSDYRVTGPECPFRTDPRSNVVKEVFNAFRARGFGVGAYYSKADWHSPDYWAPGRPAKTRNPNYDTAAEPERWARFVKFVHGQIEELVTGYGHLDILWLDAGWVRPPQQDLRMAELAAMARRHQPDLLVVDRTVGGEFENYHTPEQEVPDKPLPYPWETCMTMGDQWSYKPNDRYKSTGRLIHLLVDVVAKGGNFLLNVGPRPDGTLPPEALERMNEIGAWLKVNGEAIYGTRPVAPYRAGSLAFTQSKRATYAIYLPNSEDGTLPPELVLPLRADSGAKLHLLGRHEPIPWHAEGDGIRLQIPADIIQHQPCRHAWAFRIPRKQ